VKKENRKMEKVKTCVAMTCESRWYLPGFKKVVSVDDNVHVVDWPADAQFIKNTAYGVCGLPGEVWDNDANCRAENGAGWLCVYHARGDESVLPAATVADLLDVGKLFAELNAGIRLSNSHRAPDALNIKDERSIPD
jgi:hypothetical protein